MHQHCETMHYDKYDAYKGKVREQKVKQLKAAFWKQRKNLPVLISQTKIP